MKNNNLKITYTATGKENIYFALFCDCSEIGEEDAMLIGVFASRKEARDFNLRNSEWGKCPARHFIRPIKKLTLEMEGK